MSAIQIIIVMHNYPLCGDMLNTVFKADSLALQQHDSWIIIIALFILFRFVHFLCN